MFDLRSELHKLQAQQLYRKRRVVQSWLAGCDGTIAIVDGIEQTVFCSNDYLGLAHHPYVAERFQQAVAHSGVVGSSASHLITGHSYEHHALEEALAEFTGRKRALLFSTGYMANLGVASALLNRGDVVLEDRRNHASLLDAGLLSGALFKRYAHGDAAAAGRTLAEGFQATALVLTDGVFSMDGDIAPLPALCGVARRYNAWLMVDDAHGLGVLGSRGRGTLEKFGLGAKHVPILMGTLGKALGTFGAFIAGDEDLIELLIQKARTYLYTTALPPAVAAAARAALHLIDSEAWRRERLLQNVEYFKNALRELGLPAGESNTPIQPIIIGSAAQALAASEALWARGFWVTAIRPPTVQRNTARLRITLSASHTRQQIDSLAAALADVLSDPSLQPDHADEEVKPVRQTRAVANTGLHLSVAGQGPVLVLLHGWGLNSCVWDSILPRLNQNFTTVCIDLPGHGQSSWPPEFHDIDSLADRITQALGARFESYCLLGWSLGAMASLALASKKAGAIRKMVLVAATPKFLRSPDWPNGIDAQALDTMAKRLLTDYQSAVRDFLLWQVHGDEHARTTLRTLRDKVQTGGKPDPQALKAGLETLAKTDLRPYLPAIDVPTLIISGERDRLSPPIASKALASSLREARLQWIERAAHAPFLSHEEEFCTQVEEFLAHGR